MEQIINKIYGRSNGDVDKNSVRLRVLWFTTSPSLSRRKLDGQFNVGTSWIEAMEQMINHYSLVDLAIAFSWKVKEVTKIQVEESRTTYYASPRRPLNKWIYNFRRLTTLPEPLGVLKDYQEIIDNFEPDVVHFFGTETPYPMIIPYLKVPHIIWFQGNLTVYHLKWHSGISALKSIVHESLKNLIWANSDLHAYVQNIHLVKREKKIFQNTQHFIGRTAWDKRLVSVMAPQAQYHHCEEMMRAEFYETQWRAQLNRKKFILVSTFRDNLYKGLETAMASFKILKSVCPFAIEWRIIGVEENSHYARVSRKVAKLPKDEMFVFLGMKPASEIVREMMNADVFIHPSHIDNSPNSVCEAMLTGIPIVATNVGGVPSILQDQKEGLLVQNGDPYAMAGAILELLNDPVKAQKMGLNARERSMDRNDRKKILIELIRIYKSILGHMLAKSSVTSINSNLAQ